jgi:hypothetical protein
MWNNVPDKGMHHANGRYDVDPDQLNNIFMLLCCSAA